MPPHSLVNADDENRYTFVFTQIPKATATSWRPMAVRSDCTAQGTDLTCLLVPYSAYECLGSNIQRLTDGIRTIQGHLSTSLGGPGTVLYDPHAEGRLAQLGIRRARGFGLYSGLQEDLLTRLASSSHVPMCAKAVSARSRGIEAFIVA